MAGASALGLARHAADVGLIRLHHGATFTKEAAVIAGHGQPDAVRHEPCGLEGHAQDAGQLVRADALLAGGDQGDGL